MIRTRTMGCALALAALAAATACAPSPDQIAPAYISGSAYSGPNMTCAQLATEAALIAQRLPDLEARQERAAGQDVALVTGAALLLPVAGLLAATGPDFSGEIASLRGQAEAIAMAARAKGC